MLAVSRNIPQAHASLKAGEWRRSDFVGGQLYRKTLGVIGFGRVGKLVAERAKAFGMDILVFDPGALEETARELGVLLVEMDELLSQSDYITLHAALNPGTTKLINADTIAQMKDGVILINAARGKLIDEAAVAEGLKSGKIKAAAIDVYSSEPPPADHPCWACPTSSTCPIWGPAPTRRSATWASRSSARSRPRCAARISPMPSTCRSSWNMALPRRAPIWNWPRRWAGCTPGWPTSPSSASKSKCRATWSAAWCGPSARRC